MPHLPKRLIATASCLACLLTAACEGSTAESSFAPSNGGATGASNSATSSSPPAPTSRPNPTVPVDEIPPGRPESWVPAGVPTTARWKEPGDELPKFTLAMFDSGHKGAVAAMNYYLTARNWALAALDPEPYLIICDSQRCKDDGELIRRIARAGRHLTGGRQFGQVLSMSDRFANIRRCIVHLSIAIHSSALVDGVGHTVKREQGMTQLVDVYTRWNGTMWRVERDVLSG